MIENLVNQISTKELGGITKPSGFNVDDDTFAKLLEKQMNSAKENSPINSLGSFGAPAGLLIEPLEGVDFSETVQDQMEILGEKISREEYLSQPIEFKDINMGDYLHGFLEGLSLALRNKGRQVITIKVPTINTYTLGMLIALYERAVAIYAEFININAFHQPGVQAYKLAAKGVLELRAKVLDAVNSMDKFSMTAAELADKIGMSDSAVEIANLLDKEVFNSGIVSRTFDAAKNQWVYNK